MKRRAGNGLGARGAPPPRFLSIVPLIFALICLPLALEMIEPNGLYGVRTPATALSDAVWYRANRVAGIAGTVAGVLGFALNRVILRSPLAMTYKHAAVLLVAIAVAVIMTTAGMMAT